MLNIASRMDRLPSTPMYRKIFLVTGIAWAFDAMVQGMVSGIMASIGAQWGLTTSQLGYITSVGMVGMALGAGISGMLADRWGRKSVVVITLMIFGGASGLSGFVTNYTTLLVLRFITGFGLGGHLPAAAALISEYSPSKVRGRNVVFLESFWAWGWIASAVIAYLFIPNYGWRIAFWIGVLPAIYSIYLYKVIPESPRYLESVGNSKQADELVTMMEKQAGIVDHNHNANTIDKKNSKVKVSFLELWSKKYIKSTIILWVVWFGINFGYYGFVLWTPSLLIKSGFDLVKSFEFTLIMCFAQLPGYFSAAYLVERIGRKKVLSIYFAGTAIAAWMFGHSGSVPEVLLFGSLLYFFSMGAWGCVYAYSPEVYPTAARASGSGWAAAFGRLGAFMSTFIVPIVYKYYGSTIGFSYVFIMLTVVFAIVSIVVMAFGEETKGKTLDEISVNN